MRVLSVPMSAMAEAAGTYSRTAILAKDLKKEKSLNMIQDKRNSQLSKNFQ